MMIGSAFKLLRKNRSFTQRYVSKNILSQSAYSKFEADQLNISASSYIELLNRLDITSEEFLFIQNNYQYDQKVKLMHDLFHLPYNQIEKLKLLLIDAKISLETQFDEDIHDVQLICEALISLYETKYISIAQKSVEPIWERLSKHEQLYLSDIRLINSILFLFPIENAIEFTNNILRRLKEYDGFQDSSKLNLSFRINLSLLLIKNKDYTEAINLIQETLADYKQSMPYQSLAIYLSREAICRYKLNSGDPNEYLNKAQQLLKIYEDDEFFGRIQQEYHHYCK